MSKITEIRHKNKTIKIDFSQRGEPSSIIVGVVDGKVKRQRCRLMMGKVGHIPWRVYVDESNEVLKAEVWD